jgi:YndJ-like protein
MGSIEGLLALAMATALPLGLRAAAIDVGLPDGRLLRSLVAASGGLAAVSFVVARGPIALAMSIPWIVAVAIVAAAALLGILSVLRRRDWTDLRRSLGMGVPLAFLLVGCAWLAFDRIGLQPLGYSPTIVLLTATHFHVAGFVLTFAGVMTAFRGRGDAGLATAGLVVGMPMTAAGFLGSAIVGWVGSIVVAVAGIVIGWAIVRGADAARRPATRALLRIAGSTLFVTMPLAAAYSTGTTFHIPTIDIPAMAAIHGGLNVIGFAIPAMAGWTLEP